MRNWITDEIDNLCNVEYGTRVVKKEDGGTIYPVYGGGGATFYMDTFNRENRLTIARFAMSPQCTRFVDGKFFLNDSGLTISPKDKSKINQSFLNYQCLAMNDVFYSLAKGSAQKNLDVPAFRKLKIRIPKDIEIQNKIVSKLDNIFEEIQKATKSSDANANNAEALFQSYLTKIFGEGGKEWKKVKLSEIAEYFNGLTYSPKDLSDSGIIVLRSSNVQNDKLDFDDIVRVNLTVKEKIIVRDGDILMCSRNGSQRLVGKTATIQNLDESMTFGTFMMVVRSKFNPFLEWFFKSNSFKKQIAGGENTMINQITRYMLDDVVLHIPPDNEIASISKVLSNLFDESRKLQEIYRNKSFELNLMKHSVLKKAFNGELVAE